MQRFRARATTHSPSQVEVTRTRMRTADGGCEWDGMKIVLASQSNQSQPQTQQSFSVQDLLRFISKEIYRQFKCLEGFISSMSLSSPLLDGTASSSYYADVGGDATATGDPMFDAKCRRIANVPAEMADSLKYTFSSSKIAAPSSESLPPQPISIMGQPNIEAVFKVGSKIFLRKQGGWKGDKSNPDDDHARQARLMKFFDAAYKSSEKGGDRAALTPEIQDICLPNDKVVAMLNCVEVIGMPDSLVSSSEGFIQAAIIERDGSVKTRRLVIVASAGNASIDATETISQMFQLNCCGLCPTTEMGSKYFNYGAKVQENHELSIINIQNAVVHVGVTKKAAKDFRASSSGAGTGKVVPAKCCGLGDCFRCPSCTCCECNCFEKCRGSRYFRLIASVHLAARACIDSSTATSSLFRANLDSCAPSKTNQWRCTAV